MNSRCGTHRAPFADIVTRNTRATLSTVLPPALDSYSWSVGGINATGGHLASSKTCTFNFSWASDSVNDPTHTPQLTSPANNSQLSYPSPVLFDWSSVPGASQYVLRVYSDPGLSTPAFAPVTTTATQYSPTVRLATGDYYWTVTPLNAQSKPGLASAASHFTWNWPATSTELTVTDLDSSSRGVRSAVLVDTDSRSHQLPGRDQLDEAGSELDIGQQGVLQHRQRRDVVLADHAADRRHLLLAGTGQGSEWQLRRLGGGARQQFPAGSRSRSTTTRPAISNLTMLDVNPTAQRGLGAGFDHRHPDRELESHPGAASYDVDVVPYDSVT